MVQFYTLFIRLTYQLSAILLTPFADDTGILAYNECHKKASQQLQANLNLIEKLCNKWRIKINETKSVHVTFTTRPKTCHPVKFYGKEIPQCECVKYLSIHLDKRLTSKNTFPPTAQPSDEQNVLAAREN